MKKKLAALITAVAMMLVLSAPAMADPFQLNAGNAWVNNTNLTIQTNVGVQNNTQVAVFGNNYNVQIQEQNNFNATSQDANAFVGNLLLGY